MGGGESESVMGKGEASREGTETEGTDRTLRGAAVGDAACATGECVTLAPVRDAGKPIW